MICVFCDWRRRRIGDQTQPRLCGLADMDVSFIEAGNAQVDQNVLTAGTIKRRVFAVEVQQCLDDMRRKVQEELNGGAE